MQVHTDIEVVFSSLHIIPSLAYLPQDSQFQTGYFHYCCVMLTLSEKYCKLFLRLYQNCHMQKKKTRDFSGIISYPLKPPSGTNFTIEQISCKSMVHHEPWGTSRFICSLLAVCKSCAFHICPRYPAHKCLMP